MTRSNSSTSPSRPFSIARGAHLAATAVVILAGAGAPGSLAQAPARSPAGPPTIADRAEVLVVEIPVQVLHGGEPVRGLTAEDFVILEGKRRYRPVGFEVVDLALGSSGRYWTEEDQLRMPIAARRHFLLLFDLSFSRPDSILRARDAVQDLVLRGMHPADLAAVATYSETQGFRLVLNFTGDRPQILAAIEELGLMDPVDRFSRDPLGLVVAELESAVLGMMADIAGKLESGQPVSRAESRRAGNLEILLSNINDMRVSTIRGARELQQQQIYAFTGALRNVARLLSEVEGRSQVILLSEGFDSSAILGNSTEDRARVEELRRAVEIGETWRVDNDERFGSSMALFGMTQVLDEFRHAGATIQAIDIGGLRAQGLDNVAARESLVRQDGLFVLANDTGGQLYRNTNDLTEAMDELLENTSVTYLLAHQPEDVTADGSFHPLEVRLTGGPKGARVYHRDGYYAPVPYGAASGGVRRLRTAQQLLGGDDGGPLDIAVLAAPFAHDAAPARVAVVIEIDGAALLEGTTQDPLPAEVYAYALRADGSVADFFAQALGLDLDQTRGVLADGGFRFVGHLDLAPGEYALRVLARNAETEAFGLSTVPIVVANDSATRPFLSTPLFPALGQWAFAREQGDAGPDALRFELRGEVLEPAARPRLASGVASELLLLGHGFDAASATVTARLEDAAGALAGTPSIEVLSRTPGAGPEAATLVASLRADGVQPGRYTLHVTVGEGAGAVSSTIEVEIGQ